MWYNKQCRALNVWLVLLACRVKKILSNISGNQHLCFYNSLTFCCATFDFMPTASKHKTSGKKWGMCSVWRIFTHRCISCMSLWENRLRFIYVGCHCSFKTALLTRGGGVGTAAAWPPGRTLQLSPLQLFPFDLPNLPFKEESIQSCHIHTSEYFSPGTNSSMYPYLYPSQDIEVL